MNAYFLLSLFPLYTVQRLLDTCQELLYTRFLKGGLMPKPAKAKEAESAPKKMVYIRLDAAIYERILQIARQEDRPFSFIASRILERGSQS